MSSATSSDQNARVEQLMTQLLMLLQHQTMDIAHLADELVAVKRVVATAINQMNAELAALRTTQTAQLSALEERLNHAGKRADWFNVQTGELMRIMLNELREIRATQVCAALSDGPLTAEVLADLVRVKPLEELVLELPRR